ncbi:radical SAM protein [Planobispora longispora]|nr:radical SAM protein [Planobispora longispora]
MPTFTCPAACSDCGTFSSPQERTSLERAQIIAAIDEAKELGFVNVVFTGGEATLRWPDLLAGISHARRLGFPVRLVTNAHWARTPEAARRKIAALMDAGLSEINYSTGDEHTRFVPIERVAYAVVAACERELPVHVMVELKRGSTVTRDRLLRHEVLDGLTDRQRAALSVKTSPWMPLSPYRFHDYDAGVTANEGNLSTHGGCTSVLQTYTVQADGRIGACCGIGLRTITELNVGHAREASPLRHAIEESEQDFLKLWIHYEGPLRVLAWAASHDPAITWQDLYAHHCQACQRLYHDDAVRAVIRTHWREVVGQVIHTAWFQEVYGPDRLRSPAEDAPGVRRTPSPADGSLVQADGQGHEDDQE